MQMYKFINLKKDVTRRNPTCKYFLQNCVSRRKFACFWKYKANYCSHNYIAKTKIDFGKNAYTSTVIREYQHFYKKICVSLQPQSDCTFWLNKSMTGVGMGGDDRITPSFEHVFNWLWLARGDDFGVFACDNGGENDSILVKIPAHLRKKGKKELIEYRNITSILDTNIWIRYFTC